MLVKNIIILLWNCEINFVFKEDLSKLLKSLMHKIIDGRVIDIRYIIIIYFINILTYIVEIENLTIK